MPHHWIHKLNESNSKNFKLDVIQQCLEAAKLGAVEAHEFLIMAWYAYNPFMTYNLKRINKTEGIVCEKNSIPDFISLLQRLDTRTVTGNAAIAEVERCSLDYDSDLWNNLLRPVILKDLKVGATITSFNKVLNKTKYVIPVFEAQRAVDSKKHPNKLVGKKILEPKLDGVRVLALVDRTFPGNIKVKLYSRNGKQFHNFSHIEDQINECLQLQTATAPWNENRMQKFMFDGEIVSENFQALMKQAQRKTNIDTSDAVYSIFDVIPLDKFDAGKWDMPQHKRSGEWLEAIRDRVNATCPSLHVLDGFEVDLDTAEGHDIMRRFGEEQVAMGYEGIMIKDPDAPYVCKRRTAWMKWKPTILVDLTIVGFEPGKEGGRNEHRLGALIVEGLDEESGKFIRVNAGGGYTDAQRDEFWEQRDNIIGHLVEIEADAITQSENETEVYSLRFPRFKRFRDIDAGEKM